MKILITGGSGLIGQYLNKALAKDHTIITLYHSDSRNCSDYMSEKVDIRNTKRMEEIFTSFQPELVIHAAAISRTNDAANIAKKDVYNVNVQATAEIAELCKKWNAKLLFTSTDLVYAGYRGSWLKEDAKLIPVSFYAETKLMGEVKIQRIMDNYLILRLGLVYGIGLNGSTVFSSSMIQNLKEGKKIKLFTDQYRTPVSLNDIASVIKKVIQMDVSSEIINIAGSERMNRVDMAEAICKIGGFDASSIIPIKQSDIPNYPVVQDVSLNTDKMQNLGLKTRPFEENIREIIG